MGSVILAKPEDLRTSVPLSKALDFGAYFNDPDNRVKIQFPSEQSAYAYLNMSKYYPTAQVMRQGQVSVLPYAIDESFGEVGYRNRHGKTVTVNAHFDTMPIDAMVVVKAGEIVYERYKTMRPDDKHAWFSVSKVTGATMLAFLEHEGKVDVSEAVSHYLPELEGSEWDTVTVEQALDMATGLNGTEHDEAEQTSRTDPDEIWFRWAATRAVGVTPDVRKRNETWADVLRSMRRKTPGHQKFEYNSIDTFVCNRIAERVADRPLNEQFSERIWTKAGMEHDAYYLASPSGNTLGFLGVNSSLRDLARFGMVFTPSVTRIAGAPIIPDAIMKKIYDRAHVEMYARGWAGAKFTESFSDDAGKIANRYQWDAVLSDGDIFKSGVGGQGVYISPTTDAVVAWFCTSDGNNQEEAMARAIVKTLRGR